MSQIPIVALTLVMPTLWEQKQILIECRSELDMIRSCTRPITPKWSPGTIKFRNTVVYFHGVKQPCARGMIANSAFEMLSSRVRVRLLSHTGYVTHTDRTKPSGSSYTYSAISAYTVSATVCSGIVRALYQPRWRPSYVFQPSKMTVWLAVLCLGAEALNR